MLGARGELQNSPKGDSDRPNFEQKKKGAILKGPFCALNLKDTL